MRKQVLLFIVMLICMAIFGACVDSEVSECEHSGGTATCLAKAICEKCGEEYGELADHVYGAWQHDETKHWKECTTEGCTAKAEEAAHAFTKSGSDDLKHWKECECGAKSEEAEHNYTENKCNAEKHWKECSCGAKSEEEAHVLSYDKDETQHWEKCACGYETAKVDHVLTDDHNDTQHWQECVCGYETAKVDHVLTDDHNETQHWEKCACGYETAKVDHVLTDDHNETQHWEKCACGYETDKENHAYNLIEGEVYDEYSCNCGFKNDEMKFKKTVDNVDKDLVLSGATYALDLTGVSDATVESIKLIAGNEEIDLGNDANALNVETLKTKTQNHGKQTITVVVKSEDGFSHTVLVPVVIVTKEIKTMTELQDSVKWLGGDMDNIYGYFILGDNIVAPKDFPAKNGGISYSSGKAFRGTLDGRDCSITFNSSVAGCGLFGTMNGATVKNVTITDSWNNAGNRPMLAYNAYNVTFEKVKLVIGGGSPKNGNEGYTPIIGASMHGCTFKNVEIVSNVSIANVFYDAKNNKFESLKITADVTGKFSKDIELTALPENVTIEPKTAA